MRLSCVPTLHGSLSALPFLLGFYRSYSRPEATPTTGHLAAFEGTEVGTAGVCVAGGQSPRGLLNVLQRRTISYDKEAACPSVSRAEDEAVFGGSCHLLAAASPFFLPRPQPRFPAHVWVQLPFAWLLWEGFHRAAQAGLHS